MINLSLFLLLYLQDVVSQYPEQLIYGEKTLDNSYVVFPWDKLEFKNSIQVVFLIVIFYLIFLI